MEKSHVVFGYSSEDILKQMQTNSKAQLVRKNPTLPPVKLRSYTKKVKGQLAKTCSEKEF